MLWPWTWSAAWSQRVDQSIPSWVRAGSQRVSPRGSAPSLRLNLRGGGNRVRIAGRLRLRNLPRGRYLVRVWAFDAARNRSATRRVTFRVL